MKKYRISKTAIILFLICCIFLSIPTNQAFAVSNIASTENHVSTVASIRTADMGTCTLFPADNIWNTRIDNLPINAKSADWINSIGNTTGFHMDFGSGTWDGGPIGIPFNVVESGTAKSGVTFYYYNESDIGLYPIPS
ncbi:MAG: hypothetical protein WCP19_14980, partial [Chloroflexota bacterium]